MKKDPHSAVNSVASFLGHNLGDEVIESIVDQTSWINSCARERILFPLYVKE